MNPDDGWQSVSMKGPIRADHGVGTKEHSAMPPPPPARRTSSASGKARYSFGTYPGPGRSAASSSHSGNNAAGPSGAATLTGPSGSPQLSASTATPARKSTKFRPPFRKPSSTTAAASRSVSSISSAASNSTNASGGGSGAATPVSTKRDHVLTSPIGFNRRSSPIPATNPAKRGSPSPVNRISPMTRATPQSAGSVRRHDARSYPGPTTTSPVQSGKSRPSSSDNKVAITVQQNIINFELDLNKMDSMGGPSIAAHILDRLGINTGQQSTLSPTAKGGRKSVAKSPISSESKRSDWSRIDTGGQPTHEDDYPADHENFAHLSLDDTNPSHTQDDDTAQGSGGRQRSHSPSDASLFDKPGHYIDVSKLNEKQLAFLAKLGMTDVPASLASAEYRPGKSNTIKRRPTRRTDDELLQKWRQKHSRTPGPHYDDDLPAEPVSPDREIQEIQSHHVKTPHHRRRGSSDVFRVDVVNPLQVSRERYMSMSQNQRAAAAAAADDEEEEEDSPPIQEFSNVPPLNLNFKALSPRSQVQSARSTGSRHQHSHRSYTSDISSPDRSNYRDITRTQGSAFSMRSSRPRSNQSMSNRMRQHAYHNNHTAYQEESSDDTSGYISSRSEL